MKKKKIIPVIYWSNKESTEIMAEKISNGIDLVENKAILINVVDFEPKDIENFTKIVLGCPAMEGESLEKTEFEPFFNEIGKYLKGKNVALFGSHGWGNGAWMKDWEKRITELGGILFEEGLVILGQPDREGRHRCVEFGKTFGSF
ncbi:MAG: flavodoxin domain-containing protein [Eubacteriaceae bacterium]